MQDNKQLQDLMKFIFPTQVPLASEMTAPIEPMEPTQPQAPIEDFDAMVQQDKLDKQLQAQVAPPQAPVDTKVASKASVQVKDSLNKPAQAPVESPQDFRSKLLEQFKQAREANKASVQQAQGKDADVALLNALNKSFNQMGTGIANQAGYTKIASNPLEVASELAKQAEMAGAKDTEGLKQDYGIMADKEGVDLQREKMKIDAEDRAFDRKMKLEQLAIERAKLGKEKQEKETAGQRELDKQAAKEYQEWSSGGAKIADSEIAKLEKVVNDLSSGKVSTGGLTGMFPDQLTSKDVLSARSDVQSSVMGSLRALLGAQFTEKEGERVIKNTWNEADSTENNVARLSRLVNDLRNKSQDKSQKAQYFQENKSSLAGFKADPKQAAKSIAKKEYSANRNQTRITYTDGSTEILDGKK